MQIHITIAKNPTYDYPFAVVIDDGYELLCRSVRDCQIAVSGAHHALIQMKVSGSMVIWDARIDRTAITDSVHSI